MLANSLRDTNCSQTEERTGLGSGAQVTETEDLITALFQLRTSGFLHTYMMNE